MVKKKSSKGGVGIGFGLAAIAGLLGLSWLLRGQQQPEAPNPGPIIGPLEPNEPPVSQYAAMDATFDWSIINYPEAYIRYRVSNSAEPQALNSALFNSWLITRNSSLASMQTSEVMGDMLHLLPGGSLLTTFYWMERIELAFRHVAVLGDFGPKLGENPINFPM